jgi:hypothetical protein
MKILRLLLLASAAGAISPAASAEDMTVVIANSHPYAVMLEMYSQDRDHVWPGGNEAYLLDDGETKNISLACEDEETICYGAWVQGDDSTFWGVGRDNSQACDDCCYTCDGGSTEEINLVE